MRKTEFKAGDIVVDKANPMIDIVILYPLTFKWRGYQRYCVGWYDNGQFNRGKAYEQELKFK